MSILTAWSPFFHSSARMRGRVYLTSDRVRRVAPADDGELVRAEVQGQDRDKEPYLVTIRRDGKRAEAECTCPRFENGAYCKHIWATLLDVQHHEGPGVSPEELARLHVRAPKARKRDGAARAGSRPQRQSEPEWIGRLSLLRPVNYEQQADAASPGQNALPAQQQVCYMILPAESERAQLLVVELRQRTPTATGWSRSKPLKLEPQTIPTLADATDRELCALLLGGTLAAREGAFSRGEAKFRLPPGAWRTLLRRMIATGRCFLGASDDEPGGESPLRWSGDSPWTLWMAGRLVGDEPTADTPQLDAPQTDAPQLDAPADASHLVENGADPADPAEPDTEHAPAQAGDADADTDAPADADASHATPDSAELLVNLELRRDDQAIPIERPTMVLGGLDGVVVWDDQAAALDDRDALRWVSHFRDEHRRRDEPRPIRVPRADVDRFLDRLYMLPQLPEIDLPEGIGRVPQHLEPTRQLEIFSPGSTEASKFLPSSAKNQLVARVSFGYDTQRVTPGQPGRFIAVSSSASRTDEPALAEVATRSSEAGAAVTDAPAAEPGTGPETDADADADSDADAGPSDHPTGTDAAPESESVAQPDVANDLPPDGLLIQRNHRAEREAMTELIAHGLRPLSNAAADVLALPAKQVPEAVGGLLSRGWSIAADRQSVRDPGAPRLSVTTGTDWFELRGSVRFERADGATQDVPLPQILAAAQRGEHMIRLDDGSQGLVPEQWLEQHGLLTAMGQLKSDHLRFTAPQAALLDALLADQPHVAVDEPFERLRQRLSKFRGVQPLDPAPQFKGALRPYQREGLGWMAMLRWFGTGGILADDMGLGKTIQVLAILQMRAHETRKPQQPPQQTDHFSDHAPNTEGASHRPSLVVAPRSVVFNWVDEAQKFTSDLRVMAYAGADRQPLRDAFAEHDMIVTSYGLLRRDIEALSEFEFDYVILDEAQAIKNPGSQAAKAARLLRGNHRLALTGTPVENHLGDLWSIFEFLNPGMLGASARFNDLLRSAAPNGNGHGGTSPAARPDDRTLGQIGQALRPFILRRTKKQVLADLPDKTEQTIACEMEPSQRKIYDELRSYYRTHLLSQLDQLGGRDAGAAQGGSTVGGKAGFMVLEALLRLRQAACHPALINDDYADAPSAKIDVLMELLEDVSAEGSKALVFSQFTSMLALVRQRFEQHNVRYCYLDGQTRNRREVVHRFQSDPRIDAFLVSLKSGGFGLNLTAAEYVFILDPWWNPAVEQQAIDRTHRIGQTRRVFAYRLICQDTVEQRIIDLQAQKQQIADAIVGGEQHMLANLTRDDLERLLS